MLTHLSVQNYTLVDQLDLEIQAGMTVITGETGAGKSILLDALGQTLGNKADSERVRRGAERADIRASFDIKRVAGAQQWLEDNDLNDGKGSIDSECLLRRVITREGRSRGYINGQPATLTQLRQLGEHLIDIHSQHEHQSLLKKDTHRRLLDDFGQQSALLTDIQQTFQHWQQQLKHYRQLNDNAAEASARFQLLSYQVEELEQLDLQDNELAELEREQKRLANGEEILQTSHRLSELCSDDDRGLRNGLQRALQLLQELPEKSQQLSEAEQLLNSAQIQVDEACSEIDNHIDSFHIDPERLQQVEERLSAIYQISRKHRLQPEQLSEFHRQLSAELAQLSGGDAQLESLEQECQQLASTYQQQADKLSKSRHKVAQKLAKQVNQQLSELAMENAKLQISLSQLDKPSAQGRDDIEFLISTNPGQPPRPLAKVASGGELSRISLAIQVITAQTSNTPTLAFDEVDVGIGGATADVVGRLLRQLAGDGQILCVTHLAQVASKGHQHLQISKSADDRAAQSTLIELSGEEKIEEVARMLGGQSITEQSLAHAEEMLTQL